MAKLYRHPETNAIVRVEMNEAELARVLGIDEEKLRMWEQTFPPSPDDSNLWSFRSEEEVNTWRQRAALLRTNMSERAVANVEKAGLLSAYARLAEDCPEGITAHVWRSYGTVVLMQVRYGKTIGPEELARRAALSRRQDGRSVPDVETARKHLRLLVAAGLLSEGKGDWQGRWEHQGLPAFFQD